MEAFKFLWKFALRDKTTKIKRVVGSEMGSNAIEPVTSVRVHSLCVMNVGDHLSRANGAFGVLLGFRKGQEVVVCNLFGIVVNDGNVDQGYLHSRCGQFSTVLPDLAIVGIYHVTPEVNSLSYSVLGQVGKFVGGCNGGQDLVVVKFCGDSGVGVQYSSYVSTREVPTMIVSNDSERIAALTAVNNANYTGPATKLQSGVNAHQEKVSSAVNQLDTTMATILRWVNNDTNVDLKKRIEINNQIVHLASKLQPFKYGGPDTLLQLQTSQLALLTEQLTALEAVKLEIGKNITRYSVATTSSKKFWSPA